MEPALAQFEQGRLPSEAGTGKAYPSSAFVHKVMRLRRTYKAEAQFWVNALKGEPIAWELLRPNDARLRRLGELARHLDHPGPSRERLQSVRQPGSEIERRRRAVLPFLDDFAS